MKYHLSYKILLYHFFSKTFPIFFGVYFTSIVLFTTGILLLDGMSFKEIFTSFFHLRINEYYTIFGIFVFYILAYLGFYLGYTAKNLIGEHTLKVEDDNFVWKGNNQEIRTNFKRVKKLIISSKYFSLKFDGLKKATIYRSWSIEGFEEFSNELKSKVQEFNGKIIEK